VTTVDEAAREGSFPAGTEAPESTAEMRACARESVAPASPSSLDAVTQRVRSAGQVASRAVALLDRPGSLVHSQPPTFRQARDRHHECAGHYQALLLRLPRLAWGYVHLVVVMPVLYLAVWLTESPARFFVAVAAAASIWFFA
jgi:hypothetical protein